MRRMLNFGEPSHRRWFRLAKITIYLRFRICVQIVHRTASSNFKDMCGIFIIHLHLSVKSSENNRQKQMAFKRMSWVFYLKWKKRLLCFADVCTNVWSDPARVKLLVFVCCSYRFFLIYFSSVAIVAVVECCVPMLFAVVGVLVYIPFVYISQQQKQQQKTVFSKTFITSIRALIISAEQWIWKTFSKPQNSIVNGRVFFISVNTTQTCNEIVRNNKKNC